MTDRLTAALADRYRIERELGQGGMATVYLAADLKHDRNVALKVLKPELAAVLGAERFIVEIKTTAALQHPHILPLFDSGVADGFLYYVMPFIDGETLRAKLDRETQLGVDEAVRITSDVAEALQYAHEHGVIHRDIKPENLGSERQPYLIRSGVVFYAVDVTTEPKVNVGRPRLLFEQPRYLGARDLFRFARDWDVHPNGDRFVMALAGEGHNTRPAGAAGDEVRRLSDVVLVVNWFTELEARMRPPR